VCVCSYAGMSVRPSNVVNGVQPPPSSRMRQVLAVGLEEKKVQESKAVVSTGASTSSAVPETYTEVWKLLGELKEKMSEATKNKDAFRKLKKSIEDSLESLKDPSRVSRLKGVIKSQEKENESIFNQYQEYLNQYKDDLKDLEEELASREAEVKELQDSLTKAEKSIRALEAQLKNNAGGGEELQKLQSKLEEEQTRLRDEMDHAAFLNDMVKQLRDEKEKLALDLTEATSEWNKYERLYESTEDEKSELERQIRILESDRDY